MKKLFADPHFNVMDGLDTYIDDYGKPDPIPAAMLRKMAQAKFLGLFDDEPEAAPRAAAALVPPTADAAPEAPHTAASPSAPEAFTDGAAVPPVRQSDPTAGSGASAREPENCCHDDVDLRLQQDDAPGRPGAAEGARP